MAESTVVSSVEWLGTLLMEEGSTLWRVEDEVGRLLQKLQVLQEYLQDADANPGAEIRALTTRVRKLAYDAEDLIDIYILKVTQKTQIMDRKFRINRNWVVKFASFLYKAPRVYKLGKHIQALQNDVSEVTEKLDKQEVKRTSHVRETNLRQKAPRPSYPYDEGEYVVGWEKEIESLVQVLMGQGKDQDVHVVGIMGMGGSGKTTLARKLYNHPYVKECFNCWAWVYISQHWSIHHVLSEILRQVAGPAGQQAIKSSNGTSKEELVDKLHNFLKNKSYLVVLDDVWRRSALQDIVPALPYSKGSKIIITTRNQQIIQFEMPQSSYVYEPRPLDENQGWQILSKFALSHRMCADSNKLLDMKSFERLGKDMLKQCDGLPLAIVALAGILSTKVSIGEWQQVGNAVRTRVMEGMGRHMYDRVGDLLALSYDDLPYYLKPCFLHLGLVPEDCQIPTGMLTRMWAAEGLVTPYDNMRLEDVAMQRLEELSHRFMVQVVKTNFKGDIKIVRLHDLLRDLCVKKATEQGFLKIYTSTEGLAAADSSLLAIHPRRAALHSSTVIPAEVSHLRSLVLLTQSSLLRTVHPDKEPLDLGVVQQSFKLLRVLNLWGIKTASGTLPEQIGRLIHLRYLGIRATNITELPISIGSLRHLLTLDYRNIASNYTVPLKIPNVLWKLVRLRHLFLPMDHLWNLDQLKLHKMGNLQTLWGVKEDGMHHWLAREVTMLSKTLKKLRVFVSTEEDLKAVFCCPSLLSVGDGRLHTFYCEWSHGVALQHLVKPLSQHQYLNKLLLIGNIRIHLQVLLPPNLIRLELKDSLLEHENPMSPLGTLAHLKLLKLSNFYVGSKFACKLGSFPQLEVLFVENLQNLETWSIEQGAMPCLKKLEITQCKKLKFPQGLEFVTSLQQLEFFDVSKGFHQKAEECGWSSQQKLRLPHNCKAIIEKCDSPIDVSSIRRLLEELTAGVFLNNKMQRYWVTKKAGCYCNCFMVYPVDFIDFLEVNTVIWDWKRMEEREYGSGTIITVAGLSTPGLLDVSGRLEASYLSPNVKYEIALVIMLEDLACGWDSPINLKLSLPYGSVQIIELIFDHGQPRGEWIRIAVGQIEISNQCNNGEGKVKLSMVSHDQSKRKRGLVLKGVIVEPKT